MKWIFNKELYIKKWTLLESIFMFWIYDPVKVLFFSTTTVTHLFILNFRGLCLDHEVLVLMLLVTREGSHDTLGFFGKTEMVINYVHFNSPCFRCYCLRDSSIPLVMDKGNYFGLIFM